MKNFKVKKYILYLLLIVFLPVGITLLFTFITSEVYIGMGSLSVADHLMGRKILLETKGLYKDVDVEEYVVGVMAGTVPADYDIETLKVQAVLIRTNVLKEMEELKTSDGADLSYQYLTMEERKEIWGQRNYEKNEKKMEQAVSSTANMVLYFEEELIMALYHEVSIGKTASAKEILDQDISYLQSVESSQDVEAKHYMNIVLYSKKEMQEILGTDTDDGGDDIHISIENSTENGFVKEVKINDTVYSGEEVMNMFQLPSLNYYVEEVDNGIRFVCLGTGNCMGVSLYGANYMAQNGATMEDIIAYYYKDVSLKKYN